MIDTFRNTALDVHQKLRRLELRQELFKMSYTRKVDQSIIASYNIYFRARCLKDLHIKQRKNEQHSASQKNDTCKKIRGLKITKFSQQNVKTASKISDLTC